ncbi:MAG: glycine betaine ABC transporter substrate-binding protein, partial [Acidimicrobiales bacterium]
MRFRTTRGLATRGPATVAALAAVLGLVAAACGGATNPGAGTSTTKGSATSTGGGAAALPAGMPGKGKPAVVVGDKNFSEEYVLGDLYSQALRDKGYTVSVKSDIGSSEIIDAAFSSGKIDLYPEYTGEIVATLAHEQLPNSSEGTYAAAKKWEEQHRGATLLAQTPFQDVDTVVVKPAFAKKYKLTTVADLDHVGPHGKGVVFGGPPTFQHR